MKVAILGYDIEGAASYNYFVAQGHDVYIRDQDVTKQVPDGAVAVLGDAYLDNLDEFDLLIRTPGMQPSVILEKNPSVSGRISSGTNEFMKAAPTRNIIGITGTKGKGTTSTLIAKILEANGKKVYLGGNIGVPALSFLPEVAQDDWVVLELSSFQLIDLQYSPPTAVCLMIVPEHLNWHRDFEEYVNAKRQLFIHQNENDLTVYNASNHVSIDLARSSKARKLWYRVDHDIEHAGEDLVAVESGSYVKDGAVYMGSQEICKVSDVALLGNHNLQNICAAIAATWDAINHDVSAVVNVVSTFHGLHHRLEFVRKFDEVDYYDDSFGTTPETAIVAIEAFKAPKVLILGGADKGAAFDELAAAVKNNDVRHVIVIGNTAHTEHALTGPKIEAALRTQGYDNITSLVRDGAISMSEIVAAAHAAAEPGDVVLLSVASASFDMFDNYKDRAAKFVEAVNAL